MQRKALLWPPQAPPRTSNRAVNLQTKTTMNIVQSGSISSLTHGNAISKHLPVGTYDIQINDQTGQLEMHHRPPFLLPEKIYGNHDKFAERCIKTFSKLNRGMGVLLSGPKGCGKTLTAKKIATDSNMPVLCLNMPLAGAKFIEFLTEIENPCIIFIDEFEKVYHDEERRQGMLSILDGASSNKHLFLLTSNSDKIGEFFTNRPGRIRYHKQYDNLPMDVLHQVVEDKVKDKGMRKKIKDFLEKFGSINPDTLVSVIEECLIHGEGPEEFTPIFNVKTEFSGAWDVTVFSKTIAPKKDIPVKIRPKLKKFLDEYDENPGYAEAMWPHMLKYCEEIQSVGVARHIRPFERCDMREGFRASVYWITYEGKKAAGSRDIHPTHVKSIKRMEGGIHVEMKDGDKFVFTRPQSSYSLQEE